MTRVKPFGIHVFRRVNKTRLLRLATVVLVLPFLSGCFFFGQYGDSITSICSAQISTVTSRNWTSVVQGRNASRIYGGGVFDWQSFFANLDPSKRYDALVLALGTNDAVTLGEQLPSDWPTQLDGLVSLARRHLTPTGRLYWVNIVPWIGYPPVGPLTSGQVVNAALALGAARDGFTIIDWASVVVAAPPTPALIMPDGVHPTAAGCDVYANMISQAVGTPRATTGVPRLISATLRAGSREFGP